MCIIVPSYNNNANFRIEYNLNSIFQQNYSNYFVVILNDASTDDSDSTYRKYLDFYGIDPERYAYILNSERKTALENIYIGVREYCSEDSIVHIVDGDDEYIGKNVLKIFNAAYQKLKAGVIYSNFYVYRIEILCQKGFTTDYNEETKRKGNYRD
jgi:glycosyltransferase involved in cell wall biosynthesis